MPDSCSPDHGPQLNPVACNLIAHMDPFELSSELVLDKTHDGTQIGASTWLD